MFSRQLTHPYTALAILLSSILTGCGGSSSDAIDETPSPGTISNPIIITQDLTYNYQSEMYNGSITTGSLYFKMSNLTFKSNGYTVTLSGVTDDANLYVYTDGTYATLQCSSTNVGTADDMCDPVSDANGDLYIRIDGSLTTNGTVFMLQAGT